MKKLIVFSICLSLIICSLVLVSCKEAPDEPLEYDMPEYSLSSLTGTTGNSITLSFSEEATLNVLELIEEGNSIQSFSLEYKQDGAYVHFYTQDFVGEFRYCSFPKISTSEIKIIINETAGETWELKSATPKLIENTLPEDFRVTAYATLRDTYNLDSVDEGHFSVINNVILSFVWFDKEGTIFFHDEEVNGNLIAGEELFETSLSNLRAKARPGTNFIVSFIGRDFSGQFSTTEVHTQAMTTNKEVLAQNLLEFAEAYSLSGISFDYEYPDDSDRNADFLSFTSYLKTILPSNISISAAVSSWEFMPLGLFSKVGEDLYSLDVLEMMAYDIGPAPSYHSSFQNACFDQYTRLKALFATDGEAEDLGRQLALGDPNVKISLSKINLGLPFYSRPLGLEPYWGVYKDVADEIGKYNNLFDEDIELNGKQLDIQYFNSYQMIYDKVTFAIDHGFGGVMVWHYSCDAPSNHPFSLWGAIGDALSSRTPKV